MRREELTDDVASHERRHEEDAEWSLENPELMENADGEPIEGSGGAAQDDGVPW